MIQTPAKLMNIQILRINSELTENNQPSQLLNNFLIYSVHGYTKF